MKHNFNFAYNNGLDCSPISCVSLAVLGPSGMHIAPAANKMTDFKFFSSFFKGPCMSRGVASCGIKYLAYNTKFLFHSE